MSQQEYTHKSINDRKLNSDQKRQYGCPCGKKYLSYPALFTHVKQKHDGHAPGQLIKPKKNQNVKRGRPPTHFHEITKNQEFADLNLDEYFTSKISEYPDFDFDGQFEWRSGVQNCNEVFSKFLSRFSKDSMVKKNILHCFILLLREFLIEKNSTSFCEEQNASEIINFSNELVNDIQRYRSRYPFDRKLLIDLLWGFFTWLYNENLTDHRLQKNVNENQQ